MVILRGLRSNIGRYFFRHDPQTPYALITRCLVWSLTQRDPNRDKSTRIKILTGYVGTLYLTLSGHLLK